MLCSLSGSLPRVSGMLATSNTAAQVGEKRLKVFISYSRKDSDFADGLEAAFTACGFETLIDRQNIATGEPWQDRISKLIAEAGTVVFVISPDSVSSPVCEWETDEAERLARRLLPIVYRSVDGGLVYKCLSRLNWLDFRGVAAAVAAAGTPTPGVMPAWVSTGIFQEPFGKLVTALETDLVWVREHTRLGELAAHWKEERCADELLIRGRDLSSAIDWLARQPKTAPAPTDSIRAFLNASRIGETSRLARQRRLQQRAAWALAVVAVLLLGGLVAVLVTTRHISEREARIFASKAAAALQLGYFDRALRFALAGVPARGATFLSAWSDELEAWLAAAVHGNRLLLQMHTKTEWTNYSLAFSPDGFWLVTGADTNNARIWDTSTGAGVTTLTGHEGPVMSVAFSPDGR